MSQQCFPYAFCLAMAVAASAPFPAAAQTWINPDTQQTFGAADGGAGTGACAAETQALADEVSALARKAEQRGSATPALIAEMRGLVEAAGCGAGVAAAQPVSAGGAEPQVLLREVFADGELARDPSWRPFKGAWLYDPEFGIRAARTTGVAAGGPTPSQAVVDDAFGAGPAVPGAQLVGFDLATPNAIAVSTEITDHLGEGVAYLMMHQGQPRLPGYRVEIQGGEAPKVALWRHGRSGAERLGLAAAPELREGRLVSITLRRTSDFRLTVRVDGRDAVSVRDDGFRQGWAGFAFLNAGGDYSLREISISTNP